MEKQTITYNGWIVELKGEILTITKDGESREYDIKEKNKGMERGYSPEYFYIKTEEGFYYQFKLEVDNGFVGDKFSDDDEFLDTFACHTFGE